MARLKTVDGLTDDGVRVRGPRSARPSEHDGLVAVDDALGDQAAVKSRPWRLSGSAIRRRTRGMATGWTREVALSDGRGISAIWEGPPKRRRILAVGRLARRDQVLRRTLTVTDIVGAYLALLIALAIPLGQTPVTPRVAIVLVAPFIALAAKAIGIYDRDQHVVRKTTVDEVPSIVYLSVLYALSAWLAEALLFRGYLDRGQVFALVLMTFVLLAMTRVMARAIVIRLTPAERCLIVGDTGDATRIAAKLDGSFGVNADIIGRVALHPSDEVDTRFSRASGWLSDPESLVSVVAAHQVERVIIAPSGHDQDEILQIIRLIKALEVKVSVLPRLLEVVGSSSTFEDVDGLTLLGVRQYGVSKSSALLKRSMDIVGATTGVILLAPLLMMLAIAIKLDSRGPIFFRQRRIGRRGELFEMIKFRSMVKAADEIKVDLLHRNEAGGGLFKMKDDPRVTRVGRFLRTTSLDEMPQLFNVLAGHMSLVGPRPLVPDEDALIEGWQRRRLSVKPGMTGMWQIFGSSRIPMDEMVKIDYLYGANWSIWLDLKILLRTIPYVLRRRGM